MDAGSLREQVQDVIRLLASRDPAKQSEAIQKLAPDAVIKLPIEKVQGHAQIQDIIALHTALTNDVAVGEVKWDEETKTATVAVKSVYALPVADAPWPLRCGAEVQYTVDWENVTVRLTPDDNYPASSETAEPSRYHIASISKPARLPRWRILAFPYHVFIFLVRLVAPYVLGTLVAVMKFFQRNPLKNGVVRVSFAAVRETIQWFWSVLAAYLPFSYHQRVGTVINKDALEAESRRAPDTDAEERIEPAEARPKIQPGSQIQSVRPIREDVVKPEPKEQVEDNIVEEAKQAKSNIPVKLNEPLDDADLVVEAHAEAVAAATDDPEVEAGDHVPAAAPVDHVVKLADPSDVEIAAAPTESGVPELAAPEPAASVEHVATEAIEGAVPVLAASEPKSVEKAADPEKAVEVKKVTAAKTATEPECAAEPATAALPEKAPNPTSNHTSNHTSNPTSNHNGGAKKNKKKKHSKKKH